MSIVLTLAIAISGAVLAPRAAEAATPRFDASGSVHCSVIGKGRFTPGIANASRSVVWRFVGKLGCYGTTGSGSVAVHGAKLRAVSGSSSRTCAAKPIPAVSVDIKWFTSGGLINPTHIVWASGAMSTANSRITTNFPGPGGTLVSGSYAGAATLGHIASDVVSSRRADRHGSQALHRQRIVHADISGGGPAAACNNGQAAPAQYQKVVVFSFENRTWSSVGGAGFGSMPYLNGLAQSCSYFSSWTETNPNQNSLTQYVGQVTGAAQPGVVNDCSPSATCSTTADNIFRQARAAGKTAINYVEGATSGCSASGNAAKHIPSLYMWGADDRTFCSAQTRPYSEFNVNNLPNFAFVTPTQCNDGHDCSNSTVNSRRAPTSARAELLGLSRRSVAVLSGDEDTPVPNLQIAPTAKPGPFNASGIGYASTLKAWESMLGFPCLANACSAPNMRTVAGI
jgi:hypothetical protein